MNREVDSKDGVMHIEKSSFWLSGRSRSVVDQTEWY